MQAFQLFINGFSQGCVYALVALGFVLIYKATETVNFAQGELMMVGGFIALIALGPMGMPFWVALVMALAGSALLGFGLERFLLRPLLGQPAFTLVLMTLAISMVLRGAVMMIPDWGTETHALDTPWREVVFKWSGLQIDADRLTVIVTTAALAVVLFLGFRYTRVGIAMQAASQNQIAAHYVGIPVERLNALVWGLSGAVAALAGVLLAPMTFVHVGMGFVGLKALPAAVLGGFASLPGAFIGGLLIGLTEVIAGFYLPEGFKDIAPYVMVLLVLMFMPDGLFGGHTRKKV
jgi:branched-chain amino acid transport system permease protein